MSTLPIESNIPFFESFVELLNVGDTSTEIPAIRQSAFLVLSVFTQIPLLETLFSSDSVSEALMRSVASWTSTPGSSLDASSTVYDVFPDATIVALNNIAYFNEHVREGLGSAGCVDRALSLVQGTNDGLSFKSLCFLTTLCYKCPSNGELLQRHGGIKYILTAIDGRLMRNRVPWLVKTLTNAAYENEIVKTEITRQLSVVINLFVTRENFSVRLSVLDLLGVLVYNPSVVSSNAEKMCMCIDEQSVVQKCLQFFESLTGDVGRVRLLSSKWFVLLRNLVYHDFVLGKGDFSPKEWMCRMGILGKMVTSVLLQFMTDDAVLDPALKFLTVYFHRIDTVPVREMAITSINTALIEGLGRGGHRDKIKLISAGPLNKLVNTLDRFVGLSRETWTCVKKIMDMGDFCDYDLLRIFGSGQPFLVAVATDSGIDIALNRLVRDAIRKQDWTVLGLRHGCRRSPHFIPLLDAFRLATTSHAFVDHVCRRIWDIAGDVKRSCKLQVALLAEDHRCFILPRENTDDDDESASSGDSVSSDESASSYKGSYSDDDVIFPDDSPEDFHTFLHVVGPKFSGKSLSFLAAHLLRLGNLPAALKWFFSISCTRCVSSSSPLVQIGLSSTLPDLDEICEMYKRVCESMDNEEVMSKLIVRLMEGGSGSFGSPISTGRASVPEGASPSSLDAEGKTSKSQDEFDQKRNLFVDLNACPKDFKSDSGYKWLFHGTTAASAELIVAKVQRNIQETGVSWLGRGFYVSDSWEGACGAAYSKISSELALKLDGKWQLDDLPIMAHDFLIPKSLSGAPEFCEKDFEPVVLAFRIPLDNFMSMVEKHLIDARISGEMSDKEQDVRFELCRRLLNWENGELCEDEDLTFNVLEPWKPDQPYSAKRGHFPYPSLSHDVIVIPDISPKSLLSCKKGYGTARIVPSGATLRIRDKLADIWCFRHMTNLYSMGFKLCFEPMPHYETFPLRLRERPLRSCSDFLLESRLCRGLTKANVPDLSLDQVDLLRRQLLDQFGHVNLVIDYIGFHIHCTEVLELFKVVFIERPRSCDTYFSRSSLLLLWTLVTSGKGRFDGLEITSTRKELLICDQILKHELLNPGKSRVELRQVGPDKTHPTLPESLKHFFTKDGQVILKKTFGKSGDIQQALSDYISFVHCQNHVRDGIEKPWKNLFLNESAYPDDVLSAIYSCSERHFEGTDGALGQFVKLICSCMLPPPIRA